jgi:hypothetical protein
MIFMTVDPTVLHEAVISLQRGTELPPFRIDGPGGDGRASGRVVRVRHIRGDQFEIETEVPRGTLRVVTDPNLAPGVAEFRCDGKLLGRITDLPD